MSMKYKVGQKIRCSCGNSKCPKGIIVLTESDYYYVDSGDGTKDYQGIWSGDAELDRDAKRDDRIAYEPKNTPRLE